MAQELHAKPCAEFHDTGPMIGVYCPLDLKDVVLEEVPDCKPPDAGPFCSLRL